MWHRSWSRRLASWQSTGSSTDRPVTHPLPNELALWVSHLMCQLSFSLFSAPIRAYLFSQGLCWKFLCHNYLSVVELHNIWISSHDVKLDMIRSVTVITTWALHLPSPKSCITCERSYFFEFIRLYYGELFYLLSHQALTTDDQFYPFYPVLSYESTIFNPKDCHIINGIDRPDGKYCDIWYLSVSIILAECIMFLSFVLFFPALWFVFNSYALCFLF